MRIAVITIAANRDTHLRFHLRSLERSTVAADEHVVVAIGDPAVADVVASEGSTTRPSAYGSSARGPSSVSIRSRK